MGVVKDGGRISGDISAKCMVHAWPTRTSPFQALALSSFIKCAARHYEKSMSRVRNAYIEGMKDSSAEETSSFRSRAGHVGVRLYRNCLLRLALAYATEPSGYAEA